MENHLCPHCNSEMVEIQTKNTMNNPLEKTFMCIKCKRISNFKNLKKTITTQKWGMKTQRL